MVQDTMETGLKINNTEMVLKPGLIMPSLKVNMLMHKNLGLEDLHGLMVVLIMDHLKKITFKVKESTIGLMVDSSMEPG